MEVILFVVGLFLLKNWLYRRKVRRAAKIFAEEMNKTHYETENQNQSYKK